MKTLYLIRHAKSSWDHPELRDFDRPLNKRGLRDAPFMANHLSNLGIKADYILSSPANRAQTTARYFADALDCPMNLEQGIYEAATSELFELVHGLPDQHSTVLLFGHNPTFTYFANHFADVPIANVPTCGIACLFSKSTNWSALDPSNTRLTNFYFPKQFFKK